ncbi:U-scoloptoxin(11)-Sm5a-like [Panonychus citri]|uniref:U-scoloptoxin(11)-Sm5a-like n=1 Tax=Panonychus citri TaxID=50023 RepID=UPI0023072EBB|nr:U-scoloptoxin(11)-Sm5a-like [Panonychus citri]XP_053214152.1 U-scoloptoxin(11)-Sm5a-like [Panonychus citri]
MLLWIRIILFLILTFSTKFSYGQTKRDYEDQSNLPECSHDYSVCGYVELNNMGISSQSICQCKDFISCPESFDRFDGRTLSHGLNQYKYCQEAPRLKKCSHDEIVYSSIIEYDENFQLINSDNRIHCECPPRHIFVRNSTNTHTRPNGETIIKTLLKCSLPKICKPQENCMTISQSSHSTFIKKLCNCPMDSFCPTDTRYAAEVMDFTKGSAFSMNCI